MKIRSVRADARRHAFDVETARGRFEFPWSELDVVPSAADPVIEAAPDPELGGEGFTYRLASGAEGTVHLDHVLRFAGEPDFRRKEVLYELTGEAIDALRVSGRTKRSLARQMGTSLAQIARLLDPANGRKSLDQMVRLLGAMGRPVAVQVGPPRAQPMIVAESPDVPGPPLRKHPAHAILRWDRSASGAPRSRGGPPDHVTVVQVMWDGEEARREVARLNGLAAARDCRYFTRYTRILGGTPPMDGGRRGTRTGGRP